MVAVVMVACATEPSADISLPEGAVLIEASAEYRDWWASTEACSGRTGDFEQITWYMVPDVMTMTTGIGEKVGLWVRHDGRTAIVVAGAYVNNELVVRHEMLHDLLEREGHPDEYFVNRCGLTWESWGATASR